MKKSVVYLAIAVAAVTALVVYYLRTRRAMQQPPTFTPKAGVDYVGLEQAFGNLNYNITLNEDTTGYTGEVVAIQRMLQGLGYTDVNVTGTYDDATEAAVMDLTNGRRSTNLWEIRNIYFVPRIENGDQVANDLINQVQNGNG